MPDGSGQRRRPNTQFQHRQELRSRSSRRRQHRRCLHERRNHRQRRVDQALVRVQRDQQEELRQREFHWRRGELCRALELPRNGYWRAFFWRATVKRGGCGIGTQAWLESKSSQRQARTKADSSWISLRYCEAQYVPVPRDRGLRSEHCDTSFSASSRGFLAIPLGTAHCCPTGTIAPMVPLLTNRLSLRRSAVGITAPRS